MAKDGTSAYPYIPNSVPATRAAMLQQIDAESIEELYQDVPEELRLRQDLDLPEPFPSEYALKRHVEACWPGTQPLGSISPSWAAAATSTMCPPSATRSTGGASS